VLVEGDEQQSCQLFLMKKVHTADKKLATPMNHSVSFCDFCSISVDTRAIFITCAPARQVLFIRRVPVCINVWLAA